MAVIDIMKTLDPASTALFTILALSSSAVVYLAVRIMYNIYIHPLSSFPGPKSHAATDIPWIRALLRGDLSYKTHELHQRYGEVVRIAPNELSYNSAQAWKDIYSYRSGGRLPMEKSKHFYDGLPGDAPNIFTVTSGDHGRTRKMLSGAFSEKAMREQEPLMKVYVDLLMQRLKETASKPIDIAKWYNWTTFDIFGDLCFGESFQCVEKASHHPWVSMLFDGIKMGCVLMTINRYPTLQRISTYITPKSIQEKIDAQSRLVRENVAKRKEFHTDRADIMSYILKQQEKSDMTDEEINSNTTLLIVAGSETTATLLSGATYLLLTNPHVLKKLVKIIRETFSSDADTTIHGVANLPYITAVIDESLRLYPPVPFGLPRNVRPEGDTICGEWVPGNTIVSVNHWAAYQSPSNFTDPQKFIPERFTGDERFASDNFPVFQPFSTGPRNCIGQNLAYTEIRLILTRLLWNFDLELCAGMQSWYQQQKIYTFWERGPLMVRVCEREW